MKKPTYDELVGVDGDRKAGQYIVELEKHDALCTVSVELIKEWAEKTKAQ